MLEKELVTTDVLIIGSGIAGLRAGLAAKKYDVSVIIATKGWGASPLITAINAPLGHSDERDSPQVYYQDTLRGGVYLNNKQLVKVLASQAIPSIRELESLGMEFDKVNGRYAQRLVSGGTYPRAIHKEDRAGSEIVVFLRKEAKQQKIRILSPIMIVKIAKRGGKIIGAFGLDIKNGRFLIINAKAIILATGGIGHLYDFTTYPNDITGQGIALAYRAGAELVDMEFMQFEPTAILHPKQCRGMLIPTAMFGDGGKLVNKNDERFMLNSKYGGETKAQKHELASAIAKEVKEGRGTEHGGVYFDGSTIANKTIETYPFHFQKLLSAGFDLRRDSVEVGPAAHSSMGGVKIDEYCRTNMQGLFAAGEIAGGVHGANRIAGNGATEAIVFGRIAGESAGRYAIENSFQKIPEEEVVFEEEHLRKMIDTADSDRLTPSTVKSRLEKDVSRTSGLVRSAKILERGIDKVEQIKKKRTGLLKATNMGELTQCLEIDSILILAEAILKTALVRCESRGAHYRDDFPFIDNSHWLKNVIVKLEDSGSMRLETHSVVTRSQRILKEVKNR